MYSRYSAFSVNEEACINCGNCGVKLEADAPIGYEPLSLKGLLYPEESYSSVSAYEALSEIFKVNISNEIRDTALCYYCRTILQQLYKIWQSFVAKSNSSTVLYSVLTLKNTAEVDATDYVLNSSELQRERPTKARLEAKIARCQRRTRSNPNPETEPLQHAKKKRNSGVSYSLRRKEADQDQSIQLVGFDGGSNMNNDVSSRHELKLEDPLLIPPSNIPSCLNLYVDTERNKTGSVAVFTAKRKRGRPKKDDESTKETTMNPSLTGTRQSIRMNRQRGSNSDAVLKSPVIESASTSHVLQFEINPVSDTTASTSANFRYESENDEFEVEKPIQVRVNLSEDECKNPSEPPHNPKGNAERTRRTTFNEVRNQSPSKPLPNEDEKHQPDCSDDMDSSESNSDGSDRDFDPDDVEVRDKQLENLSNKKRVQRDQRETEKELSVTGQTSRQFPCKSCGRRFRKKIWLDKHINVIHLKMDPNIHHGPRICTFQNCGKKLNNADAMESHINNHLGIKPYICDQCAWSTTSNGLLRQHLRIHLKPEEKEELKKDVCHICGAKFKSSVLPSHMLVHTENKPFHCSFEGCESKFKDVFKLRRHEKDVHLAAPPKSISCERCGREFIRKDNLIRHVKIHEKYELSGGKMRKSRDPPVRNLTKKAGEDAKPNTKVSFS